MRFWLSNMSPQASSVTLEKKQGNPVAQKQRVKHGSACRWLWRQHPAERVCEEWGTWGQRNVFCGSHPFFPLQPYLLLTLTNFSNIYFDPQHSEVFLAHSNASWSLSFQHPPPSQTREPCEGRSPLCGFLYWQSEQRLPHTMFVFSQMMTE